MTSTLDGGEHRNRNQSINQYHTSIKPQSYSRAVWSVHYCKAGLSCCSNTNTVPMAPVSLNLHEAWWSIAAWHSQGRWQLTTVSTDILRMHHFKNATTDVMPSMHAPPPWHIFFAPLFVTFSFSHCKYNLTLQFHLSHWHSWQSL